MKIVLNRTDEQNRLWIWETEIKDATYTTTYGLDNGKKQVESKTVTEGKNVGKANYSSPEEQAILQVVNKARKAMMKGYEPIVGADIIEKYTGKEVKKVHFDVPEVMCAGDGTKRMKYIEQNDVIIVQPKLDGFRGLSDAEEIYSRSRKAMTGKIPHLIPYLVEIKKALNAEWLDGELFSEEITFNDIQSIMLKKPEKLTDEDLEAAKSIKFNLFDYVSKEPQIRRTEKLMMLKGNEYVKIVPSIIVDKINITKENIDKLHDQAVLDGHEGIMIRFPYEPYHHDRVNTLLKWKVFKDMEALIVDVVPEKNDKSKLGAMVMELPDGKRFNARPAMTDKEKAKIFANKKFYIGKIGVIKYQNLDATTGVPRFPVFKGVRSKDDLVDK